MRRCGDAGLAEGQGKKGGDDEVCSSDEEKMNLAADMYRHFSYTA